MQIICQNQKLIFKLLHQTLNYKSIYLNVIIEQLKKVYNCEYCWKYIDEIITKMVKVYDFNFSYKNIFYY